MPAKQFEAEDPVLKDYPVHNFFFDVSYPSSIRSGEVDDVMEEVFYDDIYELENLESSYAWIDAGCHIGAFSMKAISTFQSVTNIIDTNEHVLVDSYNNISMLSRMIHTRDYNSKTSHPHVIHESVESAHDILNYCYGYPATALKLDVQGSEVEVILDGSKVLAKDGIRRIVMEWHHPVHGYSPSSALEALEDAGYDVYMMKPHRDTLLDCETWIIGASL